MSVKSNPITATSTFGYKGIKVPGPTWNSETGEVVWDSEVPEEIYIEILFGIKPKDIEEVNRYMEKVRAREGGLIK